MLRRPKESPHPPGRTLGHDDAVISPSAIDRPRGGRPATGRSTSRPHRSGTARELSSATHCPLAESETARTGGPGTEVPLHGRHFRCHCRSPPRTGSPPARSGPPPGFCPSSQGFSAEPTGSTAQEVLPPHRRPAVLPISAPSCRPWSPPHQKFRCLGTATMETPPGHAMKGSYLALPPPAAVVRR